MTVDGAVLFRGNMPRNEVRKFDASRTIKIKVNDGNAIRAWYDQKDLGKLGRRREQIEKHLYSWGHEVESNAVEVHVHHLRRKLRPELIQTVRGIGYTLVRDTAAA